MKITVNKESFLRALACINGIVSQRPTIPILSNVLLETKENGELLLSSTDMEIGISKNIEADIHEEGSITIPAKKLMEIVRELPEKEVEITVSRTNAVSITSGKAFIKLIGLSRDDFPAFPSFNEAHGFNVKREVLQDCLRMTSFAVSLDENKYVLNGMLLQVQDGLMKIITTDGRRLAYAKKEINIAKDVVLSAIIPLKAINELQKIEDIVEDICIINLKNQIVFKFEKGFIISRLIEGHFPDYEKVIPAKGALLATIKKDEFSSGLRRAALLTSKEAQGVKLDFLSDKILISAKSPNLGELKEEITAVNKGDDFTVGFNPKFLLDVLKNLHDKEILFEITGTDKPGVIKKQDGDYLCVIMPMQIN